ncbi:hypothetical protein GCM10009616_11630 [Microlunatus lacustris]
MRRLRWGGAAVALGAATVLVAPPGASAEITGCVLEGERQIVGLPMPDDGRAPGAVDVRSLRSSVPSVLVLPPDRAGGDPDPQEFGAAVVAADFDDDGCVDLLVGAPGANRVYLVDGEQADERVAAVTVLAEDVLPEADGSERFGAALAVERVYASPGEPGSGLHRVWIGAPGAAVEGQQAAGAVVHHTIDAELGLSEPTVISQNSPGVPGSAETGDRFGEVLEPIGDVALPSTDEQPPPTGFPSGVAVGVPREDVGSKVDAGMVALVPAPGGKALPTPRSLTQDSAGVSGSTEAGDRFGSALDFDASPREPVPVLWVGTPREDLGRTVDAGSVHRFQVSPTTVRQNLYLTQDSAGVPGAAEAGDRFGSSVESVISAGCSSAGRPVVAIGSPNEDVGGRSDAGMLSLYSGAANRCGPLTGGSAGDLTGSSVAQGPRGQQGVEDDYADTLVWGSPGEDVGSVRDAGVVQAATSSEPELVVSAFTASSGAGAGLRYGSVLGSYALNAP